MSENRRVHNLKIVASDQTDAFTFQGLRFSPAEADAYNRIDGGVYTWTPVQEAARHEDQALRPRSRSGSAGDGRRRARRAVPQSS